MIIIGLHNINISLKKILYKLSKDPTIIIIAETLSNIKNKKFILHIDQILIPITNKKWNKLKPEILITINKNLISKRIKILLKKYPPKYHWHIENIREHNPDTYNILSSYFMLEPEYFLKKICNKKNSKQENCNENYSNKWISIQNYRKKKHNYFMKKLKFSDLKVFDVIFKKIPSKIILQLGNSTIIRYQQYFKQKKNITSYGNIGTSGIDGSVSTAIGCSIVNKKPVTLIIGDLSFFYDSNALWNNYTPNNFRIILINNNGGNIFKMIPKSKKVSKIINKKIENKHYLTTKYICKTYNWKYYEIKKLSKLSKVLNSFWDNSYKPILIEIITKNIKNEIILKNYFNFIK